MVTNVPLAEITRIDENVDDGDPQGGNIQIASRIGVGGFSNQMVVVILEDIVIDPVTGLPDYELSGTSL